jgi:uncharacterized protein YqeY
MSTPDDAGALLASLRQALADALRARDLMAATALRSALGAIGNAEAVPAPAAAPGTSSPHVAGAMAGLGAAEAQRRALTAAQVRAVVQAEIDERLSAAASYELAGHADRAARLRREAGVLIAVMPGPAGAG